MVLRLVLVMVFSLKLMASSYEVDYSNSPLDVEGQYTQKKVTVVDRMRQQRQLLEKKTEEMARKQMERMRIKAEMEMMKKLQQSFENQFQAVEAALNE